MAKLSKEVRKNRNKLKRLHKAGKKNKLIGKKAGVSEPEFVRSHDIKRRRCNPKCSIKLSGKQKRKVIKRIKKVEQAKSKMDVDEVVVSKKVKTSTASTDVTMSE